ncbi:MAG: SDR family NAD(P)-dependent oxidoreductase [Gemmatimonadota bacterium]
MSHEERVVLVTGASTGIGRAVAGLLGEKGLTVFGTSRRPTGVEPVPGVEWLPLDVHSDESVAACVKAVVDRAGRVDVLINNAGFALGGPLEAATLEEAKAQFETNLWGTVRLVKAVLPGMRARRSGRILNISSLVGLVPIPFLGFYSASKFALEGYTEALRHEVKPLGIHVSLLEPGFIKTPLTQHAQSAADRIRDYEPWRERAFEAVRKYADAAPDPSLVARAAWRVLASRSPRLRYRVGKEAIRVYGQRRFLPEALFERGLRRAFHL